MVSTQTHVGRALASCATAARPRLRTGAPSTGVGEARSSRGSVPTGAPGAPLRAQERPT